MSRSRNRIIVACLLTAALGLMLYPPWRGAHYIGHRLLWNGLGNPDWSRLVLELCLLAIIGTLAVVVAPVVARLSPGALKTWLRCVGLVLACAGVTILALTAGYDAIIGVTLWREYDRKIRIFQANALVLRESFPMVPDPYAKYGGYTVDALRVYQISNVHEAEFMLRHLGWGVSDIQRADAMFLSASVPESYEVKTLSFLSSSEIAASGAKGASFEFYIRDADSAKRFFAPLPDWYTEALEHNIEVARVPDWMKPGAPPHLMVVYRMGGLAKLLADPHRRRNAGIECAVFRGRKPD